MSLECAPASELLHVSVNKVFSTASDDWAGGEREREIERDARDREAREREEGREGWR